ncbi:MAG: hypothetical protein R6V10_15090 [bacterium]
MERNLAIESGGKDCSFYSIAGVNVRVECDHPDVHERIREHLAPYRLREKPQSEQGLAVSIKHGHASSPVPDEAKPVLHYDRLQSFYISGKTFFTDYFSTLELDRSGTALTGNLSDRTLEDGGPEFFVDLLFNLSLFEGLRFHGLYYLHAAALMGPDGTGYLISGNSGVGKTSLTLSLIEAGYKFLSDDTVFVRLVGDSEVEVVGFVRDFHLPGDLVSDSTEFARFRDLPEYSPYNDKKRLRPDEWFHQKRISSMKNPSIILFPEVSDTSELVPLPKQDAFPRLLPQSLAVMFHPDIAPLHLESLKRLVNHAGAFQAKLNRSIKGSPAKTRELFEKARDMAREGA